MSEKEKRQRSTVRPTPRPQKKLRTNPLNPTPPLTAGRLLRNIAEYFLLKTNLLEFCIQPCRSSEKETKRSSSILWFFSRPFLRLSALISLQEFPLKDQKSEALIRPQLWLLDVFFASHPDDRRPDMIQFKVWAY